VDEELGRKVLGKRGHLGKEQARRVHLGKALVSCGRLGSTGEELERREPVKRVLEQASYDRYPLGHRDRPGLSFEGHCVEDLEDRDGLEEVDQLGEA
jgi:hypothetical protein